MSLYKNVSFALLMMAGSFDTSWAMMGANCPERLGFSSYGPNNKIPQQFNQYQRPYFQAPFPIYTTIPPTKNAITPPDNNILLPHFVVNLNIYIDDKPNNANNQNTPSEEAPIEINKLAPSNPSKPAQTLEYYWKNNLPLAMNIALYQKIFNNNVNNILCAIKLAIEKQDGTIFNQQQKVNSMPHAQHTSAGIRENKYLNTLKAQKDLNQTTLEYFNAQPK